MSISNQIMTEDDDDYDGYDDAVLSGEFNWFCWLPGTQLCAQGSLFAPRVPTSFGRRVRPLQGDAHNGP